MKFAFSILEKLLKNPTGLNLVALNRLMTLAVPFNAPHGFSIQEISSYRVVIKVPNRKLNHNHLSGIHACAIATVGEYCAGMSLLKTFGPTQYRFILANLSVQYTYQGKTDLTGSCSLAQIELEKVQATLTSEGKFLQTLETYIRDKNDKQVAVVTTTWQIKSWEQVKTKI